MLLASDQGYLVAKPYRAQDLEIYLILQFMRTPFALLRLVQSRKLNLVESGLAYLHTILFFRALQPSYELGLYADVTRS